VRRDLAVPRYLKNNASTLAIAYVEINDGQYSPQDYDTTGFDLVWFTPRTKREDPCAMPIGGIVSGAGGNKHARHPHPYHLQKGKTIMPTSTLELLMYQIGQLFLFPVLVLVAAMFAYSFYALGSFILQALQRRRHSQHLAGFPLLQHVRKNAETTSDELDLLAHKLLEPARIASRIAPMLGLIGTMIPMGPH
jgi:hypothetical protein